MIGTAIFVDAASLAMALDPVPVDVTAFVSWAGRRYGALGPQYWFDANGSGASTKFHSVVRNAGFRVEMFHTAGRGEGPAKQVGVDVGLTVRAIMCAFREPYRQVLLVAGDGDFFPLAKELVESFGVRLHVLSRKSGLSCSLRNYAETVTYIEEIAKEISYLPLVISPPECGTGPSLPIR